MKKILITGGAGFIGFHLSKKFINEGFKVDLVDNFNKTILSILKFLKLPWEDSVLRFNKTAKDRFQINTPSYDQVIQPIYKSATNRWKLYEKQLSRVYPTLEPWIKKFNY